MIDRGRRNLGSVVSPVPVERYGNLYNWPALFDISNETRSKYGALYNYFAITDLRGICNTGWRVPTIEDWNALITYVGGESVAGGKLKETGYDYWNYPNQGASNQYGFNLRGSGRRLYLDGTFTQLQTTGYYWALGYENSPSMVILSYYWNYLTVTSSDSIGGMSLRLVKETTDKQEGETGIYTQNDGSTIKTIVINGVEWTSENVYESQFADHTTIPFHGGNNNFNFTNAEWLDLGTAPNGFPGTCCYNNDSANILQIITTVTDKISPEGFHIPTIDELLLLNNYAYRLSALGVQTRLYTGEYFNYGLNICAIWSSSPTDPYDPGNPNAMAILLNDGQIEQDRVETGMIVRCIMNDPTLFVEGAKMIDASGNEYDLLRITDDGMIDMVVMTTNLKTTKYADGNPITLAAANEEWAAATSGAYCENVIL